MRITIRAFTPDDYEKEEKYLRKMSLRGWHFKERGLMVYMFKKGLPKDCYYRLDYITGNKKSSVDYLQIFSDDNWEHVSQNNSNGGVWHYFRKESDDGRELSIYTDDESKIALLTRLRNTWTINGIISALPLCSLFVLRFDRLLESVSSGEAIAVIAIAMLVALFIVSIRMYIRLTLKIKQLRKDR